MGRRATLLCAAPPKLPVTKGATAGRRMQMNPHNVATQRCVGSHPNCWICAKPGILIVDRRTADLRASPQFSFGAHFAADERAPEAQVVKLPT